MSRRNKSHGMSHQGLVNRRKDSVEGDNEHEEGDGVYDTIEFDERIENDLKRFDAFSLFRLRKHVETAIRHRGTEHMILFLERCKREGMSIDDAIKKLQEL